MKYIKLDSVRAFPDARANKEQAVKVLEEAAEVFGAWQVRESYDTDTICEIYTPEQCMSIRAINDGNLLDELADTIQACCNLASALGVTDLTPYLARCEERNRKRGRYE